MLIGWLLFALPVWAITCHLLVLRERRQAVGAVGLALALLAVAVALALAGYDRQSDDPFERLDAEVQALMLVMGAALLADLVAVGWWLAFLVRRAARY